MLKKVLLFMFFYSVFHCSHAFSAPNKTDSLSNILILKDQYLKEKKLIVYILHTFDRIPMYEFKAAQLQTRGLLYRYKEPNRIAFEYFIEGIYQRRTSRLNEAENNLLNAIEAAGKNADHYLLYTFFSHLAFLQTYKGNTIDAVNSFRLAKQEAVSLKDARLQVLIAINISDIFYRNYIYNQSLYNLDQAQSIFEKYRLDEPRIQYLIYYNKAETFFRMNRVDSLKFYHNKLAVKKGLNRSYTYKMRTKYYLDLLNHNYASALQSILALKKDTSYQYTNTDEQNLAEAYYLGGKLDSAKYYLNRLLAEPEQDNHPEIKFRLYEVLGEIAGKERLHEQAAQDFKQALKEYKDHLNRLTQVGNISSQIKLDEIQGLYLKQEQDYKKQRLWLILLVVVALLVIGVVAMIYRNVRQKRYYEKLLFAAKKEELAYINSHEIRRHLCNIKGIMEMIKQSEDKQREYFLAEDHLYSETEKLDKAIKNISLKLDH
jgi:flagellar basal body-associated protein FliL